MEELTILENIGYDFSVFFKTKESFINMLQPSPAILDRTFLIYHGQSGRVEITFRQLYDVFDNIDQLLSNTLSEFGYQDKNVTYIFCVAQNILGITLFTYFMTRGICFVPVDHECTHKFSHQIRSLKNTFRRLIVISNCSFSTRETLTNIEFIEINNSYSTIFHISLNRFDITFLDCEIMSSNFPLYYKVNEFYPLMYVSYTSGTTGLPKSVLVTYSSFMPCLQDSLLKFGIDENSVVYLSSPFTFDPSILQVLWCLVSKCRLIVLEKSLALKSDLITNILLHEGLTHIQCTPSFLYYLGCFNVYNLLHDKESRLGYVILGGEAFPSRVFIKQIIFPSTKIFPVFINLYGSTEVSPWMSYFIIDCQFLMRYINDEVSIPVVGVCFPDTFYKIERHSDEESLLFTGTFYRVCVIDGDVTRILPQKLHSSVLPSYISTGDLVSLSHEGLIFHSRVNSSIKRWGKLVNLETVCMLIQEKCGDIIERCVVTHSLVNRGVLIRLYYSTKNKLAVNEELMIRFKQFLPISWIPDTLILVDHIPLNSNGKIDVQTLKRVVPPAKNWPDISDFIKSLVIQALSQRENDPLKHFRFDANFVDIGGDSMGANLICEHIKNDIFNDSSFFDENLLFSTLQNRTIKDLCDVVRQIYALSVDRVTDSSVDSAPLSLHWQVDMGKCLEASPVLLPENKLVFIGSHAGIFYCIGLDSGSVHWSVELPDRIVSTAAITSSERFVAVGSYDFKIYCFCIESGLIYCDFATAGIVKTAIVSIGDDRMVCCSNDGYMYFFDVYNKVIERKVRLDDTRISSTPYFSIRKQKIFCATIGGVVGCLNIDGGISWKVKVKGPIFSAVICYGNRLVVPDVEGNVWIICQDTGVTFHHFETHEKIYESPVSSAEHELILIASDCGSIFSFDLNNLTLLHKIKLESSFNFMVICGAGVKNKYQSSECLFCMGRNGLLTSFNLGNFEKVSERAFGHHCTTPAVIFEKYLLFGSDNNKLSCYNLE